MRVHTLKEAIMHTGTELQALKVKMALSCHANYWWICVTSLKVNETDYKWEKIKNHISGIWNSSDIGLDLGKLHNQIQTLEHSRLDFTAAGAANDFFHTFCNFISGKNILSNLLIINFPCIVRILRQNIQKLATERHLAVLRNKKGVDAREFPGGLLRLDPAFFMASLLPHDLCHRRNSSLWLLGSPLFFFLKQPDAAQSRASECSAEES